MAAVWVLCYLVCSSPQHVLHPRLLAFYLRCQDFCSYSNTYYLSSLSDHRWFSSWLPCCSWRPPSCQAKSPPPHLSFLSSACSTALSGEPTMSVRGSSSGEPSGPACLPRRDYFKQVKHSLSSSSYFSPPWRRPQQPAFPRQVWSSPSSRSSSCQAEEEERDRGPRP